jgi:hypothetical protein
MNSRTTFVLIVMMLTVLSALVLAQHDETALVIATQHESSGSAGPRAGEV